MMNTEDNKQMYGVWIPGTGWLKGKDVFADYSLQKAQQVARLIGNNAVVRFIDKSIIDLETMYLENESRSKLWPTLMNFFKRNSKQSHSNK